GAVLPAERAALVAPREHVAGARACVGGVAARRAREAVVALLLVDERADLVLHHAVERGQHAVDAPRQLVLVALAVVRDVAARRTDGLLFRVRILAVAARRILEPERRGDPRRR